MPSLSLTSSLGLQEEARHLRLSSVSPVVILSLKLLLEAHYSSSSLRLTTTVVAQVVA